MDCRRRAGFTYRLSRLKPTESKKMGDLITKNEDLFFLFTDTEYVIIARNSAVPLYGSEYAYTSCLLFTLPIISVKTGHLRT